jgi:hypothetical protein
MNAPNQPPILNAPPPLPPPRPKNSFARQAALFSVIAPLVAVGISIILQPQVRGNRAAMIILGVTSVSLIVLGCIFGIVALIGIRRSGEKGILGTAIAGTIISGILTLLMLASIPGLLKAIERAKQRQQAEQRE